MVAWGVERGEGYETWDDMLAAASDAEPPDDVRPRPYLHYTSGTTGFPKGTETPPNLYPGGEADTIREHIEALEAVTPHDEGPHLTIAPLYHSGQVFAVKSALAGGRPFVVLKRFDAEKTLDAIDRYRSAASTWCRPTSCGCWRCPRRCGRATTCRASASSGTSARPARSMSSTG